MFDGEVYFEYTLAEHIPEQYKDEFFEWMNGQTVSSVKHPKTGKEVIAIYWDDWERWIRWKTGKTNILIFD